MKNLFRLLFVAFAAVLFGCMSGGDSTVILPELRDSGIVTFVNEPVPLGEIDVIKSVQFISNSDDDDTGVLVVASSKLLDELYLYVKDSESGYYVLPLSISDIKTNDPKTNSYVYSVVVDSWSYEDNTEVSAKTTESDVSYGQITKYESMDKGLTCGMSASGDEAGWIGNIDMEQSNSSFMFEYDTYSVPDKIVIYDGNNIKGKKIFTYSGGTSGFRNATVRFNGPVITVEVVGLGPGTLWDFSVNCPN